MSVGIFNYNALASPQWPSDMISRFESISYEQCEQLSGYAGKFISTSRCILNILANSFLFEGTSLSKGMGKVAKKAKICSVISLPFSVLKMQPVLQKTLKSIDIADQEGTFINSLGLSVSSVGIIDSFSTITNAFRDLIGMSSIDILTKVSLPAGFFISGIDITSRGIHLSKASKLYQEIDPAVFLKGEASSRDYLRRRLQRRLGIRQEEKTLKRHPSAPQKNIEILQERKNEKLLRMIPKSSLEDMKLLLELLNINGKQSLTQKQREIVVGTLQKIRFDLEKKMAEDTILMVALLVGVVGLTFFCMQGMGCLPYIAQMIATTIKASAGVCVDSLFVDASPMPLIGKEA